ncbi:MFS transporter [bacterium]|nr:MAG: MFS transporter [bacterium]
MHQGTGLQQRRAAQSARRRDLAGSSAGRERRAHRLYGAARSAYQRGRIRHRQCLHRRRPGHRGGDRGELTAASEPHAQIGARSRPYLLLLLSTLFLDLAANLPIGSLPLALTHDRAAPGAIALAMGGGLFASIFGSLPVGAIVDRVGRLATVRAAAVLCGVSMLGLTFAHGALGSGLLMAARGIALMAYMTAEFAYASDIVPRERIVSATSTLGMIGNLSFAIGPAAGVFLWQHGIGREQYAWGALSAALGLVVLFALPGGHDVHSTVRRRIFMRSAWLPAMGFLVGTTLQNGVNNALAVLTFHDRGVANGALIFSAMAFTTFVLRYPAGRLVDLRGPRFVAVPTAVVQALACLLAANAHGWVAVVVAGGLFGLAWAAVVPVGVGLFFERSTSRTRGAAMGAYNLAFSSGAAAGALVAAVAAQFGWGYTAAILVSGVAPLAALPFVLASPERRMRVSERRA